MQTDKAEVDVNVNRLMPNKLLSLRLCAGHTTRVSCSTADTANNNNGNL